MERPTIVPMPPVAEDVRPAVGCPADRPGSCSRRCPGLLGDTFVVDSGEDRYLFTFAPVGVASFYALAEETASKGVADWRMLRRKLPDEVFVGRRTLPHQLFGREDVSRLLANVDQALDDTIEELGDRRNHRRVRVDPTARPSGGACLVGWSRRGDWHPVRGTGGCVRHLGRVRGLRPSRCDGRGGRIREGGGG